MQMYVCSKCGYVAFDAVPEHCPVCFAPSQAFKLDPQAIKVPADPNNLSELEKKHIPAITITRKCGLVGDGCIDAHIKVGSIMHVMEEKHFIMHIDIYLDKKFVARYHMAPDKINPVVGIHIKETNAELLVVESCNLHGRWSASQQI